MTTERRCVLLFARAPREEERVKGIPSGSLLFEFARRRVESAAHALEGVDLVVVTPAPALADAPAPGVLAQRGGTFGERLENAFADARALGYAEIVAVPGDVPELRAAHLEEAFEALRREDVVLGPSPDGGVWLIGARVETASLFAGIPWRTRRVFGALQRNAPGAALLVALLDVDHPGDLAALRRSARRENFDAAADELARLLACLVTPAPSELLPAPRLASPAVSLLPASRAPPLGRPLAA